MGTARGLLLFADVIARLSMNQNQIHFSSLSSSNLAPLSRNHSSRRGQGPRGNAFHPAAAAISRNLREERCQAIVKNANGFPYSR